MSAYQFSIENGADNYPELEPLYRIHFGEMQSRLADQGVKIADYAPRLDLYFESWRTGHLINYVVRTDGEVIGYSNIYITNDMHNGEKIAQEDTIFILEKHRNGVGRKLSRMILGDLASRGVKRLSVTAKTDLRVAKLWKRMGFKEVATAMTFIFQD